MEGNQINENSHPSAIATNRWSSKTVCACTAGWRTWYECLPHHTLMLVTKFGWNRIALVPSSVRCLNYVHVNAIMMKNDLSLWYISFLSLYAFSALMLMYPLKQSGSTDSIYSVLLSTNLQHLRRKNSTSWSITWHLPFKSAKLKKCIPSSWKIYTKPRKEVFARYLSSSRKQEAT